MRFQCISWIGEDGTDGTDGTDEMDEMDDTEKMYYINIFGRTDDCKNVGVKIQYNPSFYIEVPKDFTSTQRQVLESKIKENLKWCKLNTHILKTSIVNKQKFYGFTNQKLYKFVEITFKSKQAMTRTMYLLNPKEVKKLKYGLQNTNTKKPYVLYESNVDPLLRFCHKKSLKLSGWCEVNDCNLKIKLDCMNTDYSYLVKYEDVTSIDKEEVAPIIQASFDIETYSYDGGFPNPDHENCPVIQIATTFQKFGELKPYKNSILTLKQCNPIEGAEVKSFKTEYDLLVYWRDLISSEKIDVIIGYNIWGFDLWYLARRALVVHCYDFFRGLGKIKGYESKQYNATFSSGAYGDSDFKMVETPGILQIDLLVILKREHKLTSYTLNNVSEHFLKDKKLDMPYKEMFKKYANGTVEDITEIAKYCIQDTELPLKLMNKLAILPNMLEMSKATWVPMKFLIERGQGIKVFSQILYTTLQENMLVVNLRDDTNEEINNEDKYKGATVLTAKTGPYMDSPITGLDFASLYPTIMRAHNLCHSTLVMSCEFMNVEGVTYKECDGNYFAQNVDGILPKMLKTLALNRTQAKKDMKNAKTPFMKAVYNGKQLAFKVSMNSIYGFCGANKGFLPCKPVASCTTSIGREMIEETQRLVELWYPGADVIYGDTDSVMVKFKIPENEDPLEYSFKIGTEAADKISATFKDPIELEFEKVYLPYLLFSKKRYAGLMFTNPKTPDYIDAKGIQLVRRDNCPFVKQICKSVLDTIMYHRNTEKAISIVQQAAQDLLDHKININDLVVSKSLKRVDYSHINDIKHDEKRSILKGPAGTHCLLHDYSNANLPHLGVAIKREEREPGCGPKSGDRVPYVFIQTNNHKDLQFKKAEDPDYASLHKLEIDVKYYIEHALQSPLESLFELFIDNPKDVLFGKVLNQYKEFQNKQVCINIDGLFKKDGKNIDVFKFLKLVP